VVAVARSSTSSCKRRYRSKATDIHCRPTQTRLKSRRQISRQLQYRAAAAKESDHFRKEIFIADPEKPVSHKLAGEQEAEHSAFVQANRESAS
jgi:hypothetical protein